MTKIYNNQTHSSSGRTPTTAPQDLEAMITVLCFPVFVRLFAKFFSLSVCLEQGMTAVTGVFYFRTNASLSCHPHTQPDLSSCQNTIPYRCARHAPVKLFVLKADLGWESCLFVYRGTKQIRRAGLQTGILRSSTSA